MRFVTPTSPEPASSVRLPPRSFCRSALARTPAEVAGDAALIRVSLIAAIESKSKQGEMHYRQNRAPAGTGRSRKVVKSLLLYSDGETHRERNRYLDFTV